ncbi:interferon-beta production [Mactra antiquata]
MVGSITTHCDSNDVRLASLLEAKNAALQKVAKFQKALEAAVKKAVEMSKKEIEDLYKKLEEEILQDNADVKNTRDVLQSTSDKLKKAEANRAQRFVCTKLAEALMENADNQISKRKLKNLTDVQLSFTPNQSLMEYINGLHGIGEVVRSTEKRTGMYKVKGSKDINNRLTDDSQVCHSFGCCLTLDNNQLLLTDYNNKKLKRFDINTMMMVDNCKLDGSPSGVCCTSTDEAVVACWNMIQFVSIDKKMTPTRHIKMSHYCYGIATKDDKLYITDSGSSLYMYDMTGNLLKTISQDNTGNKLFSISRYITFNKSGNMYVSDWCNGIVCFDDAGNYLSTYNDNHLSGTDGVCVDGRGNILVVAYYSHNVVQFNENGKKIGVVIKKQDGLKYPCSVCFRQKLNRLFVSMYNSDVLKMYELE